MKGYCHLKAVPMRKEPSDRSEMINQLLMGDVVELLDLKERWILGQSNYDGFPDRFYAVDGQGLILEKSNYDGYPNGIYAVNGQGWTLVQSNYDGYRGWVDNKQFVPFSTAAELAERHFLGTPYLWGGRSDGGIDCSGLTQVCFRAMDIWLPRDAWQQASCGVEVSVHDAQEDDLDFEGDGCDAQEDDLAFFHNDDGRIVHVGICRGDGTIIHASGCVRIDRLDTTGIYDVRRGCYTHYLHCVRRVRGN